MAQKKSAATRKTSKRSTARKAAAKARGKAVAARTGGVGAKARQHSAEAKAKQKRGAPDKAPAKGVGFGVRRPVAKAAAGLSFGATARKTPKVAGPVEATAIGNIMVQAMAVGLVSSLEELRAVVRESFKVRLYRPRPSKEWDSAYQRFRGLAREKQ